MTCLWAAGGLFVEAVTEASLSAELTLSALARFCSHLRKTVEIFLFPITDQKELLFCILCI